MTLTTNRFNQVTPTHRTESGASISCPFYINLTTDQKKLLLNTFRSIKQRQLAGLGYDNKPRQEGSISVVTAQAVPQAPIEIESGVNEENLRLLLFSRQGVQERLILNLQRICGVEFVTKEQVIHTFQAWTDYLFDYGHQNTEDAPKESISTPKTAKRKTASSSTRSKATTD